MQKTLLLKPTDSEQRDIFELLHRRRKKSSTIFCSQYEFEEWYDQLGGDDSPLADAIIDRIAHDSYRINITSIDAEHDKSMREVYGFLHIFSHETFKRIFTIHIHCTEIIFSYHLTLLISLQKIPPDGFHPKTIFL